MADCEPYEELADPPGNDRRWEAPEENRWRRDPDARDNRDPRRTYREHSATGPGCNASQGDVAPGAGLGAGESAGDRVIVGLPPAVRFRHQALEDLPNSGAEADVLLVCDITTGGPGSCKVVLRVVKVFRRNMHADHAVWAKREEVIRRPEEHWTEQERQWLDGNPGLSRALTYSGMIAGAILIMFIVPVGVGHKALTANAIVRDIGNGLVGAAMAEMVVITEMNLATPLGSDSAHYAATGDSGLMFRRTGAEIHGVSRGCLLLFLIPPALSFASHAAFVVLAIGYASVGVLQMRSWLKGRKAWIASHERDLLQVPGCAA